jgi:hypothetical protein
MCSAVNPPAVKSIVKLWLNGEAVGLRRALFEDDPATGRWVVRVWSVALHPYQQLFGLSMEFGDGTTAHGRARMADLRHDMIVFEGESLEEAAWRQD